MDCGWSQSKRAAKKDNVDRQASTCDEEVGTGSRLGGEDCTTLFGQMNRSVEDVKKEARRSTQSVSLPVLEEGQKT